jgi:outer membrane protein assembly factor BamB
MGLLLASGLARAQESAPVTVDASPSAAELLRRAQEIAPQNPGEAARLLQESVDRFAGKLVPWPPEPDRYRGTLAAVEDQLRVRDDVRERWLSQEGPVAERAVSEGRWLEAASTRAATPAGLQAMLLLAQRAMDDGRRFEARLWIDRALRHALIQDAQRARLLAAQSALQDEAPRPRIEPGVARETEAWQPLWSQENPTSWLARRRSEGDPDFVARNLDAQVEDGSALAAQPRFDRDAVLVADGTSVQALDRFSGSVLWRTLVGTATDRPSQSLGDLTVAVPMGNLVVTYPGHALPDQRSGLARVTALDRGTGQKRWECTIDGLDRPEFEELFPHGDPLPLGDLVLVQARKSNSRLESAAWILALEVRTGRLRWAIPLGAAGGVRLAASRPLGSLKAVGDDVFAATSLGVVARIDGATGETRWLRRWPAPIREPRGTSPAWQLPSPVADARLVAWLAPDASTLVGLDPSDGRTLWTLPIGVDTPVGAARSLLLGPDLLYAIGDDVVALDRNDPRRVVWRLGERLPDRSGPIRGATVLGTLADGSEAMVVPLADRVLVIAPADGRILGVWLGRGGANPALDSGQLVLAGPSAITMLMPGTDGERVLRERLAADPGDPRRGLALMELGRSWKRPALILDGATAASSALAGTPEAAAEGLRQEIITRLLEPTTVSLVGPEDAERLLGLAQAMATTPAQRAGVLLARAGRALGDDRDSSAGQAWRSIVSDPVLSLALVPTDPNRQVAAGALARHALAEQGDASAMEWERSLRAPVPQLPAAPIGALTARTRWLEGSITPQTTLALRSRPTDAVLMHERSGLTLRRAPALDPAWRIPIETREPIVLEWAPRLVVWCPTGAIDGAVLSIDPRDGSLGFREDSVSRLFEPRAMGDEDRLERSRLTRIDAGASAGRVLVLRGDGAVLAIPSMGNGTPSWRVQAPLRRMDAFDENDSLLAMVGPRGSGDSLPTIVVLRTEDGAVAHESPWPEALGSPNWIALVPQGVAVGGSDGAAVLDLAPGLPVRWLLTDPRLRAVDPEALVEGRLIVADGQRRLSALGLRDAAFTPDALQVSDPSQAGSVVSLQPLPQGWLAHRMNNLTLHSELGALRGETFATGLRRHDQVAIASDGIIAVELVQPDGLRPTAGGNSFAVRRHAPEQGLRQIGPPIVLQAEGLDLSGATAVRGWLLLGGEDRSLAIAGDAGTAEPR